MNRVALITGVTGQDGSYLAELLLQKGYTVYGMVRRSSSFNRERLKDIYNYADVSKGNFELYYGDMTDSSSIKHILQKTKPDEIYHLAAQSHVRVSFEVPEYTANADAVGTLRILEAIKILGMNKVKFYNASTSELYGAVREKPQTEKTPFYPRSPYGAAKLYSHWITVNYREAYGLFACNGILFNHESERRGESFVSKKITQQVAKIKLGLAQKIDLGNLDAKRDWGYAKEYVEAMWLMLQQDTPDDYVIATGENHTVREFVEKAFKIVGIDVAWKGSGLDEKGIDKTTGKVLVEVDPYYFRPAEVEELLGDATYANKQLNWRPKTSFEELVKIMVDYDLKRISKEKEMHEIHVKDF